MNKSILFSLLSLITLQATAKVVEVVDPSEIIIEKTLKSKVEQTKKTKRKLVIKTYDRDDEYAKSFDKVFKKDPSILLYKVPYDNMKGADEWQAQWFGDNYHDRNTVYTIYKDGKKLKALKPSSFKTGGALRSRIIQIYNRK